MNDDTNRSAAQTIIDACDHNPPENIDAHPRLFDDLDDDRVSKALFNLWQKGIVDAEWNEESDATEWWLTEFGVELGDKGLVGQYVELTENEINLDASPSLLVDPEEVR